MEQFAEFQADGAPPTMIRLCGTFFRLSTVAAEYTVAPSGFRLGIGGRREPMATMQMKESAVSGLGL